MAERPPADVRGDGSDAGDVVARAVRGDRDAVEAVLAEQYGAVTTLCRRLCGPDADDAVQMALIAIVRGLPRFDGRSKFSTWCYRVTTNACLDELRRRRRRPLPLDDEGLAAATVAPLHGTAATEPDDVADRVDIDAALQSIPDEFRAPVVLRDLCGLDYDEIATTLQVPPGTVRSRIARGRRALAEILGNQTSPESV